MVLDGLGIWESHHVVDAFKVNYLEIVTKLMLTAQYHESSFWLPRPFVKPSAPTSLAPSSTTKVHQSNLIYSHTKKIRGSVPKVDQHAQEYILMKFLNSLAWTRQCTAS